MVILDPWLPVLRARQPALEQVLGPDEVEAVSFSMEGDEFTLVARHDSPGVLVLQVERSLGLAIPWREAVDLEQSINEAWHGPRLAMTADQHPAYKYDEADGGLRPSERDAPQVSAARQLNQYDRETVAYGAWLFISWLAPRGEVDPTDLDLAIEKLRWASRDLADWVAERWPTLRSGFDA